MWPSICDLTAGSSVNGLAPSSIRIWQDVYIPEGCGHGCLTLAQHDLVYQASVPYAPKSATGVRYNDPAFNVVWPAKINVISEQDRTWPPFPASALRHDRRLTRTMLPEVWCPVSLQFLKLP
jgi:dTDP-4-dehydrorhamnose 3,5-epimerase